MIAAGPGFVEAEPANDMTNLTYYDRFPLERRDPVAYPVPSFGEVMTAIYYFSPHAYSRPSGGVATHYEHVRGLRRAGLEAFILHDRADYAPDWLSVDVPVRSLEAGNMSGSGPGPGDVVVLPEDFPAALRAFAEAPFRRVVFCQNQYYAAAVLNDIGDWRRFGVDGVVASSEMVRDFLALAGWPDAPLIPYAIDTARFAPADKIERIACMPRKMGLEAAAIAYLFRRRFPELAQVPLVTLDGLHHHRVAAELARSSVFLALGRNESFGLPPLEAMACGALVAGFHGDGDLGRPAARDAALWVDGIAGAVDALGTLIGWLREGDERAHIQRRRAEALLAGYSAQARDQALLAYWRSPP